jgi:hypothetical protein
MLLHFAGNAEELLSWWCDESVSVVVSTIRDFQISITTFDRLKSRPFSLGLSSPKVSSALLEMWCGSNIGYWMRRDSMRSSVFDSFILLDMVVMAEFVHSAPSKPEEEGQAVGCSGLKDDRKICMLLYLFHEQ